MTQLDMGKDLRDRMLSQTREGREERIRLVREKLLAERGCHWTKGLGRTAEELSRHLTSDYVMDAVEALGMNEGDTRWVGNVLKGWSLVEPTDRFVPSRRKVRRAAPVRVWVWV